MNTIVIRLQLEDSTDDRRNLLLWPDGVFTDLSGRILIWSGSNTLVYMRRPFSGRRSLKGVVFRSLGTEGTACVWVNSLLDQTWSPLFPLFEGENQYYTRPDDELPPRPEMLDIQDENELTYPLKFKKGYYSVRVGDEWITLDHIPIPQPQDTAVLVHQGKEIGCTIISCDWPTVHCECDGQSVDVNGIHLLEQSPGVWIAGEIYHRWYPEQSSESDE